MTRSAISRIAAIVLSAAACAVMAGPASADSFSFHYSTGGWHSRPWYGPPPRRHHHPPPKHHHSRHHSAHVHHYWGPPAFRPRVVVVQPPPVAYYVPPPPVIYAPAPQGGQISAVPASPVFQTASGQYCREYQAGITVAGAPQRSYGTACLMPDGTWRVVN